MKKILVFVFIFFLFPIISSVEFTMNDNFKQGETFLAKVSGNFVEPPLKENIEFYRGHVKLPMEFDIRRINEEYYIYAKLPENEANYSIKIKEVKYYSGTTTSENDLIKNFSITNQTADFSIEPGFVITNNSFYLEVQNLKDFSITISVKTNTTSGSTATGFFSSLFGESEINDNEGYTLNLKSGEIKKINFELGDITATTLKTIELSSNNLTYQIPVYILGQAQEGQDGSFHFEPSNIDVSIATNSDTTRTIYLENNLNETLNNIILSISEELESYVTLSMKEIDTLDKDEQVKINLEIISDSDEINLDGKIKAETDSYSASCSVSLDFIKDFIPSSENSSSVPPEIALTKTCSELGGAICESNQKCEEELIEAKDDRCCLATCEEISTSSTGKIIGWLLVLVILGALVWFFKSYKKGGKKNFNLLDIARGKK